MIVGTAPNHDVCPCLVLLKRDRKPFPYPLASQRPPSQPPPLPSLSSPSTPPPPPTPSTPTQPQPTPCWFLGPGADRNYWLNLCSSDSSTHRGWLTPSAPEWGELQESDKKTTTTQQKQQPCLFDVAQLRSRRPVCNSWYANGIGFDLWASLAKRELYAASGGQGFVAFITVGVVRALELTRKPHWPFLFI